MYDVSELEKLSEKLYANVEGWENGALQRIGKRVNEIGRLSIADAQALNNMAVVKGDLKVIYRELAEVTGKNIAEIEKIYSDVINEIHNDNKLLYDYRKKPFIPFEENERLHAMVRAYAKATAADMINLGKTKMLRTFDPTSKKTVSVDKAYKAVIDKAVVEVSSGASDFHSSMRSCLKTLGGNGIRVDYGGGVTRRLDTVVRQNLLWGARQTFMEYSDIIGEEIGADGIEIDAHPFCRPSHEFMQGQQYILGKGRMIDGEYFESADRALEALQDYGCLHFKFSIICGVSVPMHSKEELAELHRKNTEKINIDGVEKTGYEWKQSMRQLETKTRQLKGEREMLRAAGDKEGVRQVDAKINAIKDKYTKIGEKSGNELRYNRMSIVRQNNGLTKGGSGGIIKEQSRKNITVITDKAIERVPKVAISGYSDEQNTFIQQQHKELLRYAKDNNDSKEVAFVFEKGLTNRTEYVGNEKSLDFGTSLFGKGNDLFIMHNHPRNSGYSDRDIMLFLQNDNIKTITIAKNNGSIETLTKTDIYDKQKAVTELARQYKKNVETGKDEEISKAINKFLNKHMEGLDWKK